MDTSSICICSHLHILSSQWGKPCHYPPPSEPSPYSHPIFFHSHRYNSGVKILVKGHLLNSGLPHKGIHFIELASKAMAYIQRRFCEEFPPVSVCTCCVLAATFTLLCLVFVLMMMVKVKVTWLEQHLSVNNIHNERGTFSICTSCVHSEVNFPVI